MHEEPDETLHRCFTIVMWYYLFGRHQDIYSTPRISSMELFFQISKVHFSYFWEKHVHCYRKNKCQCHTKRGLQWAGTSQAFFSSHNSLPMNWKWTYGPTLMPWRYHLHTALCSLLNLLRWHSSHLTIDNGWKFIYCHLKYMKSKFHIWKIKEQAKVCM